jgi:hypothetical protein
MASGIVLRNLYCFFDWDLSLFGLARASNIDGEKKKDGKNLNPHFHFLLSSHNVVAAQRRSVSGDRLPPHVELLSSFQVKWCRIVFSIPR